MGNMHPVTILGIVGLVVGAIHIVFPEKMSAFNRAINRTMGPKWMADSFLSGPAFMRFAGVVAVVVSALLLLFGGSR